MKLKLQPCQCIFSHVCMLTVELESRRSKVAWHKEWRQPTWLLLSSPHLAKVPKLATSTTESLEGCTQSLYPAVHRQSYTYLSLCSAFYD